ncbi:hypothetical protein, partial [Acinetobacter baumannii]|uniref:hypothetical protein n=1 Tax=Acinetobacter baumannii TaxID=470 RepID=UPI001C07DB5B
LYTLLGPYIFFAKKWHFCPKNTHFVMDIFPRTMQGNAFVSGHMFKGGSRGGGEGTAAPPFC